MEEMSREEAMTILKSADELSKAHASNGNMKDAFERLKRCGFDLQGREPVGV
jgi:hypothetical protein